MTHDSTPTFAERNFPVIRYIQKQLLSQTTISADAKAPFFNAQKNSLTKSEN